MVQGCFGVMKQAPRFAVFKHQVAGHGGIRKFEGGRVIKPAIPKEVAFYDSVQTNSDLKQFIPEFHGVLKLDEPASGISTSSDTSPTSTTITAPHPTTSKPKSEKPVQNEFIILEDICSSYEEPCVIDLKMGIRHYGEEADAQKKARAIRKSEQSTSIELGFRICGMQVYRPGAPQYLRRDKAYGRRLTTSNVTNAFMLFLWNGYRTRFELVPTFIENLRSMHTIVSTMKGHRFYSSSLLLLYDGAEEDPTKCRMDLRMIDFAKAFHNPASSEPDTGFLLGLTKVIHTLERVLQEQLVAGTVDPSWRLELDRLSSRRRSSSEARRCSVSPPVLPKQPITTSAAPMSLHEILSQELGEEGGSEGGEGGSDEEEREEWTDSIESADGVLSPGSRNNYMLRRAQLPVSPLSDIPLNADADSNSSSSAEASPTHSASM